MSQDKQKTKEKRNTESKSANKYGSRGTGNKAAVKKGQSKGGQNKAGKPKGKKVEEKPVKVDFQKATVKGSEKLQKVLARTGKGSRREMESMISQGRVSVDGKTAFLGDRIEGTEQIRLDGHQVKLTAQEEDMLHFFDFMDSHANEEYISLVKQDFVKKEVSFNS
mgnify:CR=1 FL=1